MKVFKQLSLFLLMLGVIFVLGCEKDNPGPNGTGGSGSSTPTYELRFTCISSNPYLIEVNGNSDIIYGNSYKSYFLKKGTYSWQVTQQSGYLIYPTVKSGTVNLNQDKEIVFP